MAPRPFSFLRIAPYIFSPKFIHPRMKAPFRILSFIGLLALPLFVHAELQNGKVEFGLIKGSALLLTPESKKSPAVTGYAFEQGYRVETMKESTTELLLSNGATLILEPGTSLEVRTFRQVGSDLIKPGEYRMLAKEPTPSVTEVVVKRGKITGEVRKLNPQSTFSIKTPVGVARIRGTIYTVEYAQNNAKAVGNIKVSCVRGLVEVAVNGSNTGPVLVAAGKQMSSQASVTVTPEEKTEVVKSTTAVANSATLPKAEGAPPLAVGAVIVAPGVPEGTKVIGVDPNGNAILNNPVTISAGAEISVTTVVPETVNEVVKSTTAVANSATLPKAEGAAPLAVGAVISAPGVPKGTTVVGVDASGNAILSNPVSIAAGADLVVATPVVDAPEAVVKSTVAVPVANSNKLPAAASQNLAVGAEISGAGIPAGTKVTGVDADGNVILSNPVTISAGAEIAAAPPPSNEPPPVITPTITVTRMNSEQVSAVASTLASGSSMSADVVAAVKEIAKTAPPPAPLNVAGTTNTGVGGATTTTTSGTTTETASTGTESGNTETAPTNSGTQTQPSGGGSTGPSVLDKIIDTVQRVIEKEQQTNQSPAGG